MKVNLLVIRFLLAFVLGWLGGIEALSQGTFVIPSQSENPVGNAGDPEPFVIGGIAPYRYQQFYEPTDVNMPSGPFYITALRFRLPIGGGQTDPLDAVLPDIVIRMSNLTGFGSASHFDENLGPDTVTVVERGSLHLTGSRNGQFNIEVPFERPFLYNPTGSRVLVLDVINYGGSSPYRVGFDYSNSGNDAVSSIRGQDLTLSGAGGTQGLVTLFVYAPIPEPSVGALLLLASVPALCLNLGSRWRP